VSTTTPEADGLLAKYGIEQRDIDAANDYLGSAFRCTATLAERFAKHRQPDPRIAALLEQVGLWLADFDDDRRDIELEHDHADRFRALLAAFKQEPKP